MMLLLLACSSPAQFSEPTASLLARLDVDGSGSLTEDELLALDPAALMTLLDTDGDGVISVEELRADLVAVPP